AAAWRQRDDLRTGRGAGERDQAVAAQHQAACVAVGAVMRVVEAEGALQSQPAVLAAVHAHAGGVHALVEPLHPGGVAGIAAEDFGALGGRAGRVPEPEHDGGGDHQQDQLHARTLAQRRRTRTAYPPLSGGVACFMAEAGCAPVGGIGAGAGDVPDHSPSSSAWLRSFSSTAQSRRLKLQASGRSGPQALASMSSYSPWLIVMPSGTLARPRSRRPVRSSGSMRITTELSTLPPIEYSVRSPPGLAATTTSQWDCVGSGPVPASPARRPAAPRPESLPRRKHSRSPGAGFSANGSA